MFTRVAEFAGLKIKAHPHMLRHSCTSFLLDQGMPIQDIQKLLGHLNVQNTIGYLPVTPGCFNNINWNWSQDK